MRFRAISTGFVVSIALAVAGCGGGGGGAAASGGGADVAPAGTPVFVSINTDLGSSQWDKLKALINKFPDHRQAEVLLRGALSGQGGLDYENDVKPALGKTVDIIWLDLQNSGSNLVLVTQPKDEGKFKDLIAKAGKSGGSKTYSAKVGDWWAISNSQSALDSFKQASGGKNLSGDPNFKDAMGQISGDALLTAYVDGQALANAFPTTTIATGRPAPFDLDKLDYIAVGASAQDEGLQLEGALKGAGGPGVGASPFKSKLISGVPEGALAFADFHGGVALDQQIQSLQGLPQFQRSQRQFEQALGVRLEQVLALLHNEVALYVRPGAPLPEFTLVLEEPNVPSALATLNTIATRAARLGNGTVTTGNEGGVATKTVRFKTYAVTFAGFDDRIVITTGASGIRDYRADGPKLSDDAVYKDATGSAGVPDKSSGLLYVNLKDGIPLIENFATSTGRNLPPLVARNLAPLRSFVAYGTGKTDSAKFTAFLQIK